MREELVTIAILDWLEKLDWEIICFDFPQSGTGIMIHPNNSKSKNKKGIVPDIIAVKGDISVYFENKNRYFPDDFNKLRKIKTSGNYSQGINNLLQRYNVRNMYYGIGIFYSPVGLDKSLKDLKDIDFLISVNSDKTINVDFDPLLIFT